MAQILIEENFRRIDGRDMEALIEALAGLGVDAGPTQQQSSERSERTDRHGRWVLVLHWLGGGAERIMDDAFAAELAGAVRGVFRQAREAGLAPALDRVEPSRIAVHGADALHLRDIPLDIV